MKTNHTMQMTNAEHFVYEPIRSEVVESTLHVPEIIKLIAQMMTEPKPSELPVII